MADMHAFIRVGLTYRQLDFWTTRGYLRADVASPGSGRNRTWPQSEVRVAELMVHLTDAGVTVEAAARIARNPATGAEELRRLADRLEGQPRAVPMLEVAA